VNLLVIAFNSLHDIFKNVTSEFARKLWIVMGTQYNNMPWHYKHVQAALLADLHSFMLVMFFHMTIVNRKFEVCWAIAFPSWILNATYSSFQLDDNYVAVSTLQQTYFTMSKNELRSCDEGEVKICAASRAVSSSRTNSCVLSLYLQFPSVHEICHRPISAKALSLRLERHGTTVLHYLPEARNIFIRCHGNKGWATSSMVLEGARMLSNAPACHITSVNLHLYAEIWGETEFEGQAPLIIYPSQPAVTSDSKLRYWRRCRRHRRWTSW
jgi:hypothetical protein